MSFSVFSFEISLEILSVKVETIVIPSFFTFLPILRSLFNVMNERMYEFCMQKALNSFYFTSNTQSLYVSMQIKVKEKFIP